MEGVITGKVRAAAGAGDHFQQAWTALRHDPAVQFNLPPAPEPPKPPYWLEVVGRFIGKAVRPISRFFDWIFSFLPDAGYARFLLWAAITIGAAALLWALYNRMRHGEWRLRPLRITPEEWREDEWEVDVAGVRSWLDEADALAAAGHYAEAIHHLLFRSIEDIASRRPKLVRPALTSRELAASQGVPAPARNLFAAIARLVERSLFGGAPVEAPDWEEARAAYSRLALPSAWRA